MTEQDERPSMIGSRAEIMLAETNNSLDLIEERRIKLLRELAEVELIIESLEQSRAHWEEEAAR